MPMDIVARTMLFTFTARGPAKPDSLCIPRNKRLLQPLFVSYQAHHGVPRFNLLPVMLPLGLMA